MPVQPLPSVTVTAIGKVPSCVGVPLKTPAVDKASPLGRVLAVVKVAPPIEPVSVKVSLKAVPAVPVALTGLVTVMVWQAITNE